MNPRREAEGRALVIGGAGRMGGWSSRFLRARGYTVEVADPASLPEDLASCAHRRAWEEGDLTHDLIVVAAPLRQTATILLALAERRPSGTVLDVGSLKSPLRGGLESCGRAGVRVTSVHPMFGPSADRLDGRHVVIVDAGSAEANATAKALFVGTGATVVEMTLDEHDQAMAFVLGLSHAVNIAFFGALSRSGTAAEQLARVSSTTFEAQLAVAARVASENPHLYFEIQHLNAHGMAALDALSAAVEQLRTAVASGDEATFVRVMEQGRRYLTARRAAPSRARGEGR